MKGSLIRGWPRPGVVGVGVEALGRADAEEDGDAAVGFVGGTEVGHGLGIAEARDAEDLRGNAVAEEFAAGGVGAVGGEFPGGVVRPREAGAGFGVAFEVDEEVGVAGDDPGHGGEDPASIRGEPGGVGFENGAMGAVEDVDAEAVGGDLEFDGVLVLRMALEEAGKVFGDAAEEFELDGGGGVEVAALLVGGVGVLVGDDADGLLGEGGEGVLEGAFDGFLDLGVLGREPEDEEEGHHGGGEVGVGDLPGTAVMSVLGHAGTGSGLLLGG
ncbi:MAG: hypothetical protein M5U12_15240 [Verrucomicrobia bacterium]|nr:hypothetical protein [Verrucomicrobiota bacterium]